MGPKKRGGQGAELVTRVDGAWDEAVALVEDGGSDAVAGRKLSGTVGVPMGEP